MTFYHLLQRRRQRWKRCTVVLLLALLLLCGIYLLSGASFLSPWATWSPLEQQLILQLRLPRLISALAIGASLAISGAVLQVLLGNVLAEPSVIGISGGGSLAMVIVMFFLPWAATPIGFMIAAVLGCLLFTLFLVSISRMMRLTTTRLLLVGVALGILSGAVVTWAFYFSDNMNLRQLMYWLMGSIGGATWYHHWLTLMMLPVMVWLCWQGRILDRLMLGEQHAKQLGVDVDTMRWKLILSVSLLIGGSVALGGVIGFVGLVVPHLLRLAIGSENRYLLPLSALLGALLVVAADEVARTVLSVAELPLGVVTTTLGAPIFIWMLLSHDR